MMTWIQRAKDGQIVGIFAHPQPDIEGVEELPHDDPELQATLKNVREFYGRKSPMKKPSRIRRLAAYFGLASITTLAFISIAISLAHAQSSPGWPFGYTPSTGEWANAFASKQDYLGYTPLNTAGGALTGELTLAPSTTSQASLNFQAGVAPTTPNLGDMWFTGGLLYAETTAGAIALGPGAPGGVAGQLQTNNGTNFAGFTLGGDCTFSSPNITCNPNGHITTFDLGTGAFPVSAVTSTVIRVSGANAGNVRIEQDAFGGNAIFSAARFDGTRASPTAVQANDELGSFNSYGYDGTVLAGSVASIRAYAGETFNGTSHGSYICLATTVNGTTTVANSFCQQNDGGITIGSPAGSSKGAGTINVAGGIYSNGSLVTPGFATGHVTGQYYTSPYVNSLGSVQTVASTLYYLPFFSTGGNYSGLYIDVGAAQSGSACEVGIYSNVNGVPGSLLSDVGNVATTATSTHGVATTITAMSTPGWYFLAVGCGSSGTMPSIFGSSGDPLQILLDGNTAPINTGIKTISYISQNWAYSVGGLPAPSSIVHSSTGVLPFVWVLK